MTDYADAWPAWPATRNCCDNFWDAVRRPPPPPVELRRGRGRGVGVAVASLAALAVRCVVRRRSASAPRRTNATQSLAAMAARAAPTKGSALTLYFRFLFPFRLPPQQLFLI